MNAKEQKARSHASGPALKSPTGANEDRGDLRDGFVNLDKDVAVLAGQVAALDSKVDFKFENEDSKIDNLESKMDSGFKNVDSKFENVESKFENLISKIDTVCASKDDLTELKNWIVRRALVPVCVVCSVVGGGIAAVVEHFFF